jgi:hypothetical protein
VKDYYLKIVAIGEAAVAGAGVGVALIGAMEIATAITAQQWLAEAKHYIDYAPLVGSAVGAIMRRPPIARRRRGAAAKMVAMSGPVVPRVRAKFEGISQIAKLDETIGAESKTKSTHKSSADMIPLSTPAQVSLSPLNPARWIVSESENQRN